MKKLFASSLFCLLALSMFGADSSIKKIHIIHFSHTDMGFTDMPSVCREQQIRYLDVAIDAVLKTMSEPKQKRFYWTCESLISVKDWWDVADEKRRKDFLKAVKSGQLEITALPFNQTPFLDSTQWEYMFKWIPQDLWNTVKPKVAMQNDVNGFPRRGALMLLDRGITQLCMGTNSYGGGPPFKRPSSFWWKMPDGRRMFVYLNYSYPDGYDFFETEHWRRGPVPFAADTRYRPPQKGDFFNTDEESMRASHKKCLERLEGLTKDGYQGNALTISMTNHWRMDNDPPFIPLVDFVAQWNKMGLKPELVLSTTADAMNAMQESVGDIAPEYSGEYTDWWADGTAGASREVAASRVAKRNLLAAQSPLWGKISERGNATIESLYKDLCLFDEHTWGSSWSNATTWSFDVQAQFNEKAMLAWRPWGHSDLLLSQCARTRFTPDGRGIYVANPTRSNFSGWVVMPSNTIRGKYKSFYNATTDSHISVISENGVSPWTKPSSPNDVTRKNTSGTFADNVPDMTIRFWVDNIPPHGYIKLDLSDKDPQSESIKNGVAVKLDSKGWPVSAKWEGMEETLFNGDFCDLTVVSVKGLTPRNTVGDLAAIGATPEGEKLRDELVDKSRAVAEGPATVEETSNTIIYTQWMKHPRFNWIERRMELWKNEPRVRATMSYDRISSEAPERFYSGFSMPCQGTLPVLSCGGDQFTPFTDQIPGTCRDYFGIDGWAKYSTPKGEWLWVSRDAPLICFESPQTWTRTENIPQRGDKIEAMIYNNTWYTNFLADQPGAMEFQFDLIWRPNIASPADIANTLSGKPVVVINGDEQGDPIMYNRLFRP